MSSINIRWIIKILAQNPSNLARFVVEVVIEQSSQPSKTDQSHNGRHGRSFRDCSASRRIVVRLSVAAVVGVAGLRVTSITAGSSRAAGIVRRSWADSTRSSAQDRGCSSRVISSSGEGAGGENVICIYTDMYQFLFMVWERHLSCVSHHTIVMDPSAVVMVIMMIIVTVMVSVIVTAVVIASAIASVVSELGDACFAEGNQSRCLVPVANAIHFGPVVVAMHVIALLGDAHHWTADVPAAVRHIVTVELRCERNVAREHEARKSEELQGAHCC